VGKKIEGLRKMNEKIEETEETGRGGFRG